MLSLPLLCQTLCIRLQVLLKNTFKLTPIIVGPGIKTGIRLAAENPKEVGADLIVDAVAVKELYGGPAIVIDYGTATTFQLVLKTEHWTRLLSVREFG